MALGCGPLLFGGATSEVQGVLTLLVGGGMLLRLRGSFLPPRLVGCCLIGPLWAGLTILPLPAWLVGLLSPARLDLARSLAAPGIGNPGWLSLSVSPGDTATHGLSFLMLGLLVLLGWDAAGNRVSRRAVAWVAAGVVILETAIEIWRLRTGSGLVLGLWQVEQAAGAGTFPNRNLFADFGVAGGLFCAAWAVRCLEPINGARPLGGRVPSPRRLEGVIFLLAAVAGLSGTMLAGSRGATLGMLVGGMVLAVLVRHRSKSRTRMLGFLIIGAVVVAVLAAGSNFLLARMTTVAGDLGGRYPKVRVWSEALRLSGHFPGTGSGLGTFRPTFDHFRTWGGDSIFVHAENDLVQTLLEVGWVGTLAALGLGVVVAGRLWRAATKAKLGEPELLFGCLGAMAGMIGHGTVDFVLQSPANAMWFCCFLGMSLRLCQDRPDVHGLALSLPRLPMMPVLACSGLGLFLAGVLQLSAGCVYLGARDEKSPGVAASRFSLSIRWWPFERRKHLALARVAGHLATRLPGPHGKQSWRMNRQRLEEGIRLFPLDWDLRMERLIWDLRLGTQDSRELLMEAEAIARMSPSVPALRTGLAGLMYGVDPSRAWRWIEGMDVSRSGPRAHAYESAWGLFGDPARLWLLTPDTVEGLNDLSQFAWRKGLDGVAGEALLRLKGRVAPVDLAEQLAGIRRWGDVLSVLPASPVEDRELLLAARAELGLGRPMDVVRLLGPMAERKRGLRQESGVGAGREAMNRIGSMPGREGLAQLMGVAREHPGDLVVQFRAYDRARAEGAWSDAAEVALRICGMK